TAVGSTYQIFAKVRLIDIVRVRSDAPEAQSYKNRIISKHVDFVLCSRDTFVPLLVIELDDASHRSGAAQRRDATKDAALRAARVPLLRISAASNYNPRILANHIDAFLSSGATEKEEQPGIRGFTAG